MGKPGWGGGGQDSISQRSQGETNGGLWKGREQWSNRSWSSVESRDQVRVESGKGVENGTLCFPLRCGLLRSTVRHAKRCGMGWDGGKGKEITAAFKIFSREGPLGSVDDLSVE